MQMNWLSTLHNNLFSALKMAGDENTVSTPMYKLRSACHRVFHGVVGRGRRLLLLHAIVPYHILEHISWFLSPFGSSTHGDARVWETMSLM